MKQKPFTRIHQTEAFCCPYYSILHDRYALPGGGEGDYYLVHTRGAVMIVPILDDGRILFVRQFRYLSQKFSLEFPAGGVEENEKPKDAAKRELLEECGAIATSWKHLTMFYPFIGVSDEECHVFVAQGLTLNSPHHSIVEHTEVVPCTVARGQHMMTDGTITDGMTLATWIYFQKTL